MPISFSSPSNRDARARGAGVTAVLGPTNTGKTHLAIERMLAHSSGIIGLPLRLLAREVYNKIAERIGPQEVALVTGEEKIKPPNPRFWVATVEAMPRELDVAFVAIDEIQLGADLERGHVFTDRMLNRRGREETLVLGAATARPMVERLLPGAHVLTRPRLSQLTFSGEKKITRLPRRSAIVVFSSEEVYAIAELIRRQRGGAAVVLGALSPRTRNAQVALYQSGDVDYLIATDAIGMGLNLDVDHVAFASDRKFDGYQFRRLNPAELAQIAGRAGRAMRDGTFGTTGRCPPFETELAQALESHSFEPLKMLQWRNAALDFFSIGALQASLAEVPKESGLTRAPVAEDILVLEHAVRDDDVRALATTPEAIARLWEVCQVPDYRKISPATHAELAMTLYGFLMREGKIPVDWFARQIDEADHADGDIDTLSNRIAHIRTWTFAANRPDWLADPEHWQGVTRAVEDRLSDALHERLTERFVDRRTSVLMRRMRENTALETDISKTGDVVVEGHRIGRLDGFTFTPDASPAGSDAKTLAGAAQKALAGEIDARAGRLALAKDDQFVLAADGAIRWQGQPVGKLIAGDDVLKPRLRIIADEHLSGHSRDSVQARLELWLKTHIEKFLGPLFQLTAAEDITGIARGVAFQLGEALGVLERAKVAEEVKGLDQPARATLRKYGVRFGAFHLYLPLLLKPAPRVLALQLHALKHEGPESKGLDAVERLAASGRTSIAADQETPRTLYRIAGYRVCGERAVRVDILERLADLIRPALSWREGAPGHKPAAAFDGRGFTVTLAMTSLTGCSGEEFASILRSLGYRMEKRPKPPAPPAVVAPAALETPAAEAEAAAAGEAAPAADAAPADEAAPAPEAAGADAAAGDGPAAAVDSAIEAAPEALAEATPETTFAAEIPAEPGSEPEPAAAAEGEQPAPPSSDPSDVAVAAVEAASPDVAPADAAAETKSAEPDFIEVWRIGGRAEGPRRPRRPRPSQPAERRRDRQPASAPTPAPAVDGVPVAADQAAVPAGDVQPARDHQRRRYRRPDQPNERPERAERPPGGDRPQGPERQAAHPRGDRPERHGRPRGDRADRGGDRPERDPDLRAKYIKGREGRDNRDRRDKQPDPNSPFAKLAALKEQLEADSKDRR
ncbi:MAG: ATP-dependent helicase [Alphaproteobacteria bacterium]|jgi:ATP-dependent RNA helicase SUPV3L1/SUV3|nr:ATP-dependent helicase [Alphaproteobacteria bacterium]